MSHSAGISNIPSLLQFRIYLHIAGVMPSLSFFTRTQNVSNISIVPLQITRHFFMVLISSNCGHFLLALPLCNITPISVSILPNWRFHMSSLYPAVDQRALSSNGATEWMLCFLEHFSTKQLILILLNSALLKFSVGVQNSQILHQNTIWMASRQLFNRVFVPFKFSGKFFGLHFSCHAVYMEYPTDSGIQLWV